MVTQLGAYPLVGLPGLLIGIGGRGAAISGWAERARGGTAGAVRRI